MRTYAYRNVSATLWRPKRLYDAILRRPKVHGRRRNVCLAYSFVEALGMGRKSFQLFLKILSRRHKVASEGILRRLAQTTTSRSGIVTYRGHVFHCDFSKGSCVPFEILIKRRKVGCESRNYT